MTGQQSFNDRIREGHRGRHLASTHRLWPELTEAADAETTEPTDTGGEAA